VTRFRTILRALPVIAVTLGVLLTGIVPAQAAVHHRLTWHAVLVHCRRTHACHAYVSPAIRHDTGIGRSWPARIQYGDTTVIWARTPSGQVLTITS
jgi:hypothetical protein